jgi:uncharacterized membrane protein SirB2
MYMAFKHAHMTFVLVSFLLFALRGAWMLMDSPRLTQRWVKIAPHVNDSLLLLSAGGLMVVTGMYPGAHPWITAKIVALLAYIGLGVVALKPGRPKPVRVASFVAALLVFVYIIGVAFRKSALSFLA